jgi:DNA-binding response OmpR family regulator
MALIVAVDDDPDILALIRDSIVDHDIRTAADGNAGLALIRSAKPAVAILDVSMPGLSGYAVCQAVKDDAKLAATKVLMLTGQGQMQEVEKGFSAKADDYIVKPFSPRVLAARVNLLLAPKA